MKRLLIPPLTSALLLMLAGTFTIVHPAVELAKASPAHTPVVVERDVAAFEGSLVPAPRFAEQPAVPIAYVADPKAEPPDQQVTLPELPLPPIPPPPPPSTVTKLSAGQLYVITSIQKVLVLGSRDGFIKISSPKTPCTLYGNFVDAKPADDEGRTYASGFVYVVKAAATGQVELIVVTDLSGKGLIRRTLDVDNGTPPIPPTPPVPPGPGPTPPDPPSPAPIPVAGLRVLIVYESADETKLPRGQQAILYGKQMRDYLNAKCVVGPDAKTREWRIYDKDVSTSSEAKIWQDAMKRPRTALPWVIVSNGKTGFEGPLPATVDDTITLIKKYEVSP